MSADRINDLSQELAAAHAAGADAHAIYVAALRADPDHLTEFYRGRMAEARAAVVRLKARQAAAVRAWCEKNLPEVRDADR